MPKNKEVLGTHNFTFNPQDNSGEGLTLKTTFISNGDPGEVFTNQEITLNSYCNSASISLCGIAITPENLRQLANELDAIRVAAQQKAQ